jgi:hypothetical protein
LPAAACGTMLPAMFVVTEADATAIRAIFEKEGELSAAVEPVPGRHRQCQGAGLRPDHRRVEVEVRE